MIAPTLTSYTVTVEYWTPTTDDEAHYEDLDVMALDVESAEDQAVGLFVARGGNADTITSVKVVADVELLETTTKVIDLMAALKTSLAGGSPEEVRAAALVEETPAENLAIAQRLCAELQADFPGVVEPCAGCTRGFCAVCGHDDGFGY